MTRTIREDHREPRDWAAPWREHGKGLMCCCGSTPPASQNYYCMGGAALGGTRKDQNYQWSSGWTAKAVLSSARDSMAASTPTTTSSLYTYGGVSNAAFLTQSDSYANTDTWSTNTAMPTPARYRSAGVAISSLCYNWGGWNSSNVAQSQNDQMTPGSPSTWATKTAMTLANTNAKAANISAKGYNICGANAANANVATNYEYDPTGNSWATKTACPAPAKNGLAGFSISGTIYVMYGTPDTTRRNDGYVVDTWSSYATAPGASLVAYPASYGIDASSVGWATGGTHDGISSIADHVEYVPNAWATRTNIPVAITNAVAAIT